MWIAGLLLLIAMPLHAAQSGRPASSQPGARTTSSPDDATDRQALIEALIDKWGPSIQQAQGADVTIWRERLTNWFAKADLANLRVALQRDTYDAAMAALLGRGDRVTDATVLSGRPGSTGSPAPRLGDLTADLSYTPVAPCRIADTRISGSGPVLAGGTRSFVAMNSANLTAQGGSATGCGTVGLAATAVALNITAVTPSAAGFATVYPYGTTQPPTANMNYAAGAVVNSAVIAQIPNPIAGYDFSVYSFAQSHYVIDIVGYFAPNAATALECIDGPAGSLTVGVVSYVIVTAPACPSGYTATGINCDADSSDVALRRSRIGECAATNTAASQATFTAWNTCCRVPGR